MSLLFTNNQLNRSESINGSVFNINSTREINTEENTDDNKNFILVPIIVLLGIVISAALVYLMARSRSERRHSYQRRKYWNRKKYVRLKSSNTIDSDFESEENLLKGELQIRTNLENYGTAQDQQLTSVANNNIFPGVQNL